MRQPVFPKGRGRGRCLRGRGCSGGRKSGRGRGRGNLRGSTRGRGRGRSRGRGWNRGRGRGRTRGMVSFSRGRRFASPSAEDLTRYAKGVTPLMSIAVNNGRIIISRGSVVEFTGDAIVNAADTTCSGDYGIDKTIHQAGGPVLLEAIRDLPAVSGVRVPIGQARLTLAGNLKAKYVIHAVGPSYEDKGRSLEMNHALLANAYSCALTLANERYDISSIGFCLLSSGKFRGNQMMWTVLKIGMEAISEGIQPGMEVHLIGSSDDEVRVLMQLANKIRSFTHF